MPALSSRRRTTNPKNCWIIYTSKQDKSVCLAKYPILGGIFSSFLGTRRHGLIFSHFFWFFTHRSLFFLCMDELTTRDIRTQHIFEWWISWYLLAYFCKNQTRVFLIFIHFFSNVRLFLPFYPQLIDESFLLSKFLCSNCRASFIFHSKLSPQWFQKFSFIKKSFWY